MLAIITLLLHSHSQQHGMSSCRGTNGTIAVTNPAISSTYWLEDTTCTFTLQSQVDRISISRISKPTPEHVGTLQTYDTLYHENMDAVGTIEPFAIIPHWQTRVVDDVYSDRVIVSVHGKAMVSFGIAEDPALIFGEVLTDAYRTRDWVYGAPYALLYIHVGMLVFSVAFVLFTGDLRAFFCCCTSLGRRYTTICQQAGMTVGNTACVLTDWIFISFSVDQMIWVCWAISTVQQYGGWGFLIVTFMRTCFYVYLLYVLWEKPKPLGQWQLCGQPWLAPCLLHVFVIAYVSTVFALGHEGTSAGYYVGIPVVVFLLCGVAPLVLMKKKTASLVLACVSHFLLVMLLGIVLNVGLGLLGPACVLVAFAKRRGKWTTPEVEMVNRDNKVTYVAVEPLKF